MIRIQAGFTITYDCPQPVPMLLLLSVHPSREADLLTPQVIKFEPEIEVRRYNDDFGNICHRIVAPNGPLVISTLFEVQAICDFANDRIAFGYEHARPDKTARNAYDERRGVCRDFAHLAVTLCRCMNIPARYCTGYLGDIRVPPLEGPMDFSAWFEVFLDGPEGGRWYTFDARFNTPRIGRLLMARGRDATDVALVTNFGPAWLTKFDVVTHEITA